ncbi:hypothetical protein CC78DRAFT_578706 [Lojkania enalia]|uniref:Uncharacterized protein n=1 Tax=Lojkania enalia TaxID=147567 RepID=A0A9P4KGR3_9PLEO|nr:hypothetical protein CC78DRAFT_578706 [Didymosphaeria enalia]
MADEFHGPIGGRIVIPAPHYEPGMTMNFHFGGLAFTDSVLNDIINLCKTKRLWSPGAGVYPSRPSLSAETPISWIALTSGIIDRLELPSRNDPRVDTLKLVRDWLCDGSDGRWVIILDNTDNVELFSPKRNRRDDSEDVPASLATLLPQSHHGSSLITSRSKGAAMGLVGSYKSRKFMLWTEAKLYMR